MSQKREHRLRKLERERDRTDARLEVLERHDTQTALDVANIKADVVPEDDLREMFKDAQKLGRDYDALSTFERFLWGALVLLSILKIVEGVVLLCT